MSLYERTVAAEAKVARLQHVIDCANTPLMRDVMAERDRYKDALLAIREACWSNGHATISRIATAALDPQPLGSTDLAPDLVAKARAIEGVDEFRPPRDDRPDRG